MNKNIDIVKKNKEYKQTIDELKETNLFLERDNKLLRIKSTKSPVVQTQSVEIQTEAVEYNNISIQTETVEYNSIEIQCDATIQQQIEDVYINEDIHKLHGFLFELLSKIAKNEKYAAYVEKNENNIRLKKVLSLAKINKINNKIQMKEEELKTVTKQWKIDNINNCIAKLKIRREKTLNNLTIMLNKKGDMLNKKINKIEAMTNKRIEKANIKKVKEEQKLLAKLSKPETRGRKALPEGEKKQKVKSNKPRGRPSKKQQTNIIVEQENIDIIFDDMYEYNDIVDINDISNDLINDLMSYNIIVNNDIQENIDIIFDDMHEYNDIVDINYISNDLINDLMSYNIAVNNDIQENVVNNEEIQENISNIINILIDNVLNIVKENMINNDEIQENISNIVDKSDDIYELLSTPVESDSSAKIVNDIPNNIIVNQCVTPYYDYDVYYSINRKTKRIDNLSKIKTVLSDDCPQKSYKHLSELGRYKQVINENNEKIGVLVDNQSLVNSYLSYTSKNVYSMDL